MKNHIASITPALRPSHPQMCRKRPFCQGQALRAAYAGLDIHGRASGIKYMRATDVDASGGGSVNGYIPSKCKKAERHNTPIYNNEGCPRIPTVHFQNTYQAGFKYRQSKSRYAAYSIAASYPKAAAVSFHFTIPPLRGKQPGHSPFAFPMRVECGLSAKTMPIPCGLFACSMPAAYRQNALRTLISNLPDADFPHTGFRKYAFPFVRRYFRRPAYVSSIRFAYSLTAGEGLCPFEPQKSERQERQ